MRRSIRRLSALALLALLAALAPAARPAMAASFIVNSTADDPDASAGNGVCATAGGVCTLRAAIQEAQAVAGADSISFNIPTSDSGYQIAATGVWTIRVQPANGTLPAITESSLSIDATTQPGGRATGPKIELDGSLLTSATAAFQVTTSGTTIRGFVINRFKIGFLSTGGIGVYLNGDTADNNTVSDNWIGTDAAGTTGAGNTFIGVYIRGGNNNTIRNNVISDNGLSTGGGANVVLGNYADSTSFALSENNVIAGNRIGTTADGNAAIGGGNEADGIFVASRVLNNTIGGSAAADRNIIAGHTNTAGALGARSGIRFQNSDNDNTTVRGNYIGTTLSGNSALPNAQGITIRNDVDGALIIGNVIAGNSLNGILLEAQLNSLSGVTVQDNLIGVGASGGALGNGNSGITLQTNGSNSVGVNTVTIRGNTISANGAHGISIGFPAVTGSSYTGITIAGNAIGTAVGGNSTNTTLLNGQSGVVFFSGTGNTIGGVPAADRNIIAARFNQAALRLSGPPAVSSPPAPSSANTVTGNYIGIAADGSSILGAVSTDRAAFGVLIDSGSATNTVGPGNVISGNDSGVQLNGGSGNIVRGNVIGFSADRAFGRGNTQFGVWVLNSTGNTIGGLSAGQDNLIGDSGLHGVFVDGSSATNTIAGNTITGNDQDGILLNSAGATGTIVESNNLNTNGRDGVRVTAATGVLISRTTTSNNTGSGITLQSGANGGRAAPTLNATLASGGGGEPRVIGTASGCSSPGCLVEIFSSSTREDGEGPRYLASGTADPSTGAFSIDVTGCDRFLTATARDPVTNNTSAFTTPMVDTTTGCAGATPELSAGSPATTSGTPRIVAAGTTVTYTHTLRNAGGLPGTFSLSVNSISQGWPVSVSPTSISLNANQTTTVVVTVTVPLNAVGGPPPEATTVTATAGSTSVFATNYTQAIQTFGVDIEPPGSQQFVQNPSPVNLTYSHTITNTGNGIDTITLSATNGTIAGSPSFSFPGGNQCATLAPGASCTRTVQVTLPANSIGGTFSVTAVGGGAASDSVVDTAFTQSIIPELTSFAQRDAFPSATVQFVHTLRNAGTQTGVFTPTLTLPSPLDGWSYSLSPTSSVTLAANATSIYTVTATLPGIASSGAISGTVKTATLTVLASSGATATANDAVRVLLQPQFSFSAASITPAQGLPGATVIFTHTLQNTSNGDDSYTIVVTPTAGLDTISVAPVSPIAVARGGSQQVVIRARVVPGTLASVGVERLDATAQSVSLPRPAEVTRQDPVTVLGATVPALSVNPSSRTVAPGGVASFTYTLTNVGNQAGTFSVPVFTLPGAQPGWSAAVVGTPPPCISGGSLAANASCTIDVDVTSPSDAFAGTHAVRATVSSITTPAAPPASAMSSVIVAAVPSVVFTPDRSDTTDPGVVVTYSHIVTNTGNITDTISFTVLAPAGWTVPTPPTLTNLPPGQSSTVIVNVTPPSSILAGSTGVVTVTARSGTAPNPTDGVVDTTTINAVDAATLTPASQTNSGTAGQAVFFYPVLRNTGSTTIAYDLSVATAGWPTTIEPTTTGALAPGATLPVTVTVTIPTGVGVGQNNLATVSVREFGTAAPVLATGLYTATTAVVGSLLDPTSNTRTVLPGATVVYTHTLRNTTGQDDTFTLRTIATNGWIASVAPVSVFLAAGDSQEIAMTLVVPAARPAGEQDYSYIEVQSVADPALSARGTEITTVGRVAGVQLSPEQSEVVTPGQVIEFQHTLLNDGNALDTFDVTVEDDQGWPLEVTVPSSASVTLLRGATFPVEVRVTVPANVVRGTLNRITVRVTSQYDSNAEASVIHTTIYPQLPPTPVVYRLRLPLVVAP